MVPNTDWYTDRAGAWWRHFGAGRHFWRDLYLETAGFRTDSAKRVKAKSTIIRSLRDE
jgi:hypothetical protein